MSGKVNPLTGQRFTLDQIQRKVQEIHGVAYLGRVITPEVREEAIAALVAEGAPQRLNLHACAHCGVNWLDTAQRDFGQPEVASGLRERAQAGQDASTRRPEVNPIRLGGDQ